jgi:hypothetical protein
MRLSIMLQMMRRDDAIEITELCVLAGKPDKISVFLRSNLSPAEVKARLTAEAPTHAPAAVGSTNALADAIKKRFASYAKGGG